MDKLLNHYDKEYLKIAMLKHEETFREQVSELHRLYQTQKMLMKDTAKNRRKSNPHYATTCYWPEARLCLDLERPGEDSNAPESGYKCKVSETESDLELTLGPRSYYQKKIKAAGPILPSDSGPSFSSSSTGSSNVKGITRNTTSDDFLSLQKWAPEMGVSNNNQDRLNSPPWLFQALSLNMT